jgi:hypothetical protein
MQSRESLTLWGQCTACVGWYFIATPLHGSIDLSCPRCGADPGRLENQTHPPGRILASPACSAAFADAVSSDLWYG